MTIKQIPYLDLDCPIWEGNVPQNDKKYTFSVEDEGDRDTNCRVLHLEENPRA